MGEAKQRITPIGHRCHVTRREQFVLLMHVIKKKTTDKDERRKRKRLWEELQVGELRDKVIEMPKRDQEGPTGADPRDWADAETPVPVTFTGGTIDYLLKQIEGEQDGSTGEVLGDVEDRIIRLRDGTYVPPAGLYPPELATADEPAEAVS